MLTCLADGAGAEDRGRADRLPAGRLPDRATASIAAMRAMVEGGVDVIEVGVPYSDPLMDGPDDPARRAGRAGRRGQHRRRAAHRRGRGRHRRRRPWSCPTGTRSSATASDRFAADLAAAGGAGAITPDLIPDEADAWLAATDAHGLDRVFLVAPVLHRRADRARPPASAAASSTPPRRWASPAPATRSAATRRGLVARARAAHRPAGVRRPRRVQRRPGRRGGRLRRRRDRRLGVRPPAARRRRRRPARGTARRAPTSPPTSPPPSARSTHRDHGPKRPWRPNDDDLGIA